MRLLVTIRIRRAYAALPAEDQQLVQKALHAMAEDLRHPSLHVKRLQGTQRIWEAHASRSLRLTFETERDALILRNVGRHDEALGSP